MQNLSRDAIVATARDLFSSRGYANTTLQDISAQLGVRKGAVYYHVPRKIDLLIEIVLAFLRPIADELSAIAAEQATATGRLSRAIDIHVRGLLRDSAAARVFFEGRHELPERTLVEVAALEQTVFNAFERILAEGVTQGEFRTESPRLLALHVLALCNWPYRWYSSDGPLSRDEVIASIQRQALEGVKATARS